MSVERDRSPELLAPVGDWDMLRAAVANGADAVYFGLQEFHARRRAAHFTTQALPEIVAFLHNHNVRAYVALNTLLFSDELPRAAGYVSAIAQAGADAVIVQDLGLAQLVSRMAPSLPIHASTQMTQTEPCGIEALRALGVRRVILARELSLAEIERVAGATEMELEVFVHGALCISYSGQCLASAMLFGRSANRGECAQVCRLPHRLVIDGQPCEPGEARHPLSTRDLAAYDRIDDLVRLGVVGFKIEGRLKSAAYVAATTKVYRAAIDAAVAGRPFALTPGQRADLAQGFSRGFTRGFLDGANHPDLVDGRTPKSRGVRVGCVVGKTRRGLLVRIESDRGRRQRGAAVPLKPGDGVVFDAGLPEQDEQGGRVYSVRPAPASGRNTSAAGVELTFGRDDVDVAAVSVGSAVWKTDDPVIRRRLEQTFARDRVVRPTPLHIRVTAVAGEPLRVAAFDNDGHSAQVIADQPLVIAQRHPLTCEMLRDQFSRMGDTPFSLGRVELVGPAGDADTVPVMVPKSILNDLRRRMVRAMIAQRAVCHAIAEPAALEALRTTPQPDLPADTAPAKAGPPEIHVLVRTPAQLAAVLDDAPSSGKRLCTSIYCDYAGGPDLAAVMRRGRATGVSIAAATPHVLKPGEDGVLARIAALEPAAVLVRNLGAMAYFRERAPTLPLVADASLHTVNDLTARELRRWGAARLVPGYDLDEQRLLLLLTSVPAAWFEVIAYGHAPLFHLQHCLPAARLTEAADCQTCARPCERHDVRLRDRAGADHPMLVDVAKRTTVFSAAARSLLPGNGGQSVDILRKLIRLGVRHFRIELVRESPSEVRALLGRLSAALSS